MDYIVDSCGFFLSFFPFFLFLCPFLLFYFHKISRTLFSFPFAYFFFFLLFCIPHRSTSLFFTYILTDTCAHDDRAHTFAHDSHKTFAHSHTEISLFFLIIFLYVSFRRRCSSVFSALNTFLGRWVPDSAIFFSFR